MMHSTIRFLVACILSASSALGDELFQVEGHTKNEGNNTKITCEFPFHSVGGFCLFVDNRALGTWDDARGFCQALGGDLVDLKDANKLYEIAVFLKENDLQDVSYWTGANDRDYEGTWQWVSDSSTVKMGTPLWGDLYGSEPNGGNEEDCAILSRSDFYYMHDDICDFPSNGVICQPIGGTELSYLQPRECPPDYVIIGNTCLNIVPSAVLSVDWHEAKVYCESQGAHLVKIDDANFLGLIYDYLTENSFQSYFYLDGNDETEEGVWLFHDGSQMKRGTPFWAVIDVDSQEPIGSSDENCLYIRPSDSYFFRDRACNTAFGFICQYDA